MELYLRFAPLMAEAMHLADTGEGLSLPLSAIERTLVALAEEERGRHVSEHENSGKNEQNLIEDARFAVYAWVDEKILNAGREDAQDWLGRSLQCRFAQTTQGGQLFFTRLARLLDGLGIEQERNGHPLDLAERLESAQSQNLTSFSEGRISFSHEVLGVFCLCLVYGFKGSLYGEKDLLSRIRTVSEKILRQRPSEQYVLEEKKRAPLKRVPDIFRTLLLIVPVAVTVIFWLYCGNLLSRIPIPNF